MAKNLIPQIAQMLGVELGEEFKVKGHGELTYKLASDGLKFAYDDSIELSEIAAKVAFVALINGTDEIVKLPWKPKKGDVYYTFSFGGLSEEWVVVKQQWDAHPYERALLDKGWVYRTRKEAEDALPKVAAEEGVKREL